MMISMCRVTTLCMATVAVSGLTARYRSDFFITTGTFIDMLRVRIPTMDTWINDVWVVVHLDFIRDSDVSFVVANLEFSFRLLLVRRFF